MVFGFIFQLKIIIRWHETSILLKIRAIEVNYGFKLKELANQSPKFSLFGFP